MTHAGDGSVGFKPDDAVLRTRFFGYGDELTHGMASVGATGAIARTQATRRLTFPSTSHCSSQTTSAVTALTSGWMKPTALFRV